MKNCIKYRTFLWLVFYCTLTAYSNVEKLRCEYKVDPIGIDNLSPRLSWQLKENDKARGVRQTAYQIQVASSKGDLLKGEALTWDSGRKYSDQSIHIEYNGFELNSRGKYFWRVKVWDNQTKKGSWSEVASWEMGLLDTKEWQADWVTMKEEPFDGSLPAQYYRNEFQCGKEISFARAYVTSLGLYELYLNGNKVGDQLFTPGYTSYDKRIQYQVYDVTPMLQKHNAIGGIVGDGWYRGYIGWQGGRAFYGDQLALLVQIKIGYTDGTSELIRTNKDWKVSYGPILKSDMYNGEKYDARKDMIGWANPGFDDSAWFGVEILDHSKDVLVASEGLPVKAIEEMKPIEMITTPKGEQVLDLGQNMVGWVRMKVSGKKGDQVKLQFAEVLDKEGNFYTTNLRAAEATDIYTLKGGGMEVYEPRFTFHGFRYVKVEGYPGELTKDKITGVVIHSEMTPTGSFSCSDELINQLQSNIRWGQKDNFLDIPTDCPQRDERAGWTGDAQVFSMTAAYNFNVAAFYTKWLKDLAIDQHEDGIVPNVVPDILTGGKGVSAKGGATGWADASVIVPWTVYQSYGDVRILKEQYASMKGWVDYMIRKSGDDYLWNDPKHWHWGDWLAYNADKPDYNGSVTEKDLIATAYAYYSTTLLSKIAAVLGKNEDNEKYKEHAKKVKDAFIQEYITPNGRLVSHTQTAYALAISFDLIPENLKKKSAQYFAQDIEKFRHLTTGFLGTPLLCSTLSDIGRADLAFMLLNRKKFPSWLYPVTQGATTIWERWDTQKPDGTIIEGMNSFNHYAYGAIGEWMYNYIGGVGIDVENPGYKRVLFSPHPGGGLTNANTEFLSMYGKVKSSWKINDGKFEYEVIIPSNSTGLVTLPQATLSDVVESGKPLYGAKGIVGSSQKGEDVILELGSGQYSFSYSIND